MSEPTSVLPDLGRRGIVGRGAHVAAVLVLCVLCAASPARAQQTLSDTSRATQAQEATLRPLPLPPPAYGRAVVDSLPTRTPWTTFEYVLDQASGSFLYDLGPVAWPHGWSRQGLAPHRWRLRVDAHGYHNPLTGRPQVEVLPTTFFYPPRLGSGPGGVPTEVHLDTRDILLRPPLTELRFRRDSNGLQSIDVLHSQQHRVDRFGPPTLVQITGGYGGQATAGAYDGADLRSGRRLWARLRARTNRWSVTLSDFSVRHRIGARGEVVPPIPALFRSIYLLPLAETSVEHPGARRRTFRNDLSLAVRGPILPGVAEPTLVSGRWTAQTYAFAPDYAGQPDTTWSIRTHGAHGTLRQPLRVGAHRLTLEATGQWTTTTRSNVAQIGGSRWEAHGFVHDSLRLGRSQFVLSAGAHATSAQRYPSASLHVTRPWRGLRLEASLSASGQPAPWMVERGFETLVVPLDSTGGGPGPTDLVYRASAGVSARPGAFSLSLEGFGHRIDGPLDYYGVASPSSAATIPDTLVARTAADPFLRAGAALHVGWRADADRGLYATSEVTAQQFLNPSDSPLHERVAETLPALYGRVKVGARFVLFHDLITDLWVQARGWTAMNSRWFHPPTGLLTVPPLDAPVPARPGGRVGPNGTVDVHAEAILRGAKLFFTFENVASDTQVQPGSFVVPVHPLPTLRFRFGVHWPIFN